MSYDMDIGGEFFNYTYNVSGMWYAIFPEEGIRKHYGLSGAEAKNVLSELLFEMIERQEELEKMNPDNGWGSYEGALEFVFRLLKASIQNPDEIWEGD